MIIVILFICLSVILSVILIYEVYKEKYLTLNNIGANVKNDIIYSSEKKPYPKGGLKYNKKTDYSHFKQRRESSQNRTDGQDG